MAAGDFVTESQIDSLNAAIAAAVNDLQDEVAAAGGVTNLTRTLAATTVTVESDTGTDAVIPAADGVNAGVMTSAMQVKLAGVEASADVTDAGNVGAAIHGASTKATPVDADTLALIDTEAANVLKKVTVGVLKNLVIAAVSAGAPATLDTIDEIAAALGDDPNAITTITTALSNRLRIDAAQGLDGTQQAQGRSNLGIGTSTQDFAADFNTAIS